MSRNGSSDVSLETLKDLYRYMVTAREVDLLEQSYTGRGEAFFHVSGAGHEVSAALAPHLTAADWLHVHYRDKALMLARGISSEMLFLSLFNKDDSHSRGRQMNAHMSDPKHKILSLVGPVGNSALQAAGVADVVKDESGKPVVLCGLGDGMTQQGEVLEAIAQTVRDALPVLFVIQDNAFAISTKTAGRTFYSHPDGPVDEFYGIPIRRIDGRDPLSSYRAFGEVVSQMREDRKPAIVVFQVDRLDNHTNADDQRMYRTAEEIEKVRQSGDPLVRMKQELLRRGLSEEELDGQAEQIREQLVAESRRVQRSNEPEPYTDAKKPLPERFFDSASEYRGDPAGGDETLTMLEAIRETLDSRMAADDRVTLFGEDLEDPKGDVFGITRGLTQKYAGRVKNSPLAEATIVGFSVGRALAGGRPVAFLQFADFLPIAYNQIFAEMGSMYWRTDGAWQVPMILMVTCGGYRPGLGPFHASSLEAIAAHTPGVDVFMPSTAGDAVGLLNAAFESERPTIFFYPKNCLNDRSNATSKDVSRHFVPLARARFVRDGSDITLVGYGNTVGHCLRAADALAELGVGADVIDLRSLVPWDTDSVVASAEKTRRVVIVHEDNHTAGMGAEIAATLSERASVAVSIRRVTRADTYVPCNFANQLEVLPSYRRVLETSVELLGGEIRWKLPEGARKGQYMIEAIGSSPSDESITVVEWYKTEGDSISSGELIADLEADKAAVELKSPVSGTIEKFLAEQGDTVKVGTPIIQVKTETESGEEHLKPVTKEDPGTPVISGIEAGGATIAQHAAEHSTGRSTRRSVGEAGPVPVAIAGVAGAKGSRTVTNDEIADMGSGWAADDIRKRTGIESRPWLAEGESGVDLARRACEALFEQTGTRIDDVGVIICATETPSMNTPSTANLLHYALAGGRDDHLAQAFDINAACSGYLYALQSAYDILQSRPDERVLLVTTEQLSRHLDVTDPATAPIFGDAATATLIVGGEAADSARARVFRPSLAAKGESGEILRVPARGKGPIFMDGPKVFLEAIKGMMGMLELACTEAEMSVDALDLIVPHQANQRIINAIRQKLKAPSSKMYSNIRNNGNTSSSTIPLCLEEIFRSDKHGGARLGLTAFGGGFTFGAAVLEIPR